MIRRTLIQAFFVLWATSCLAQREFPLYTGAVPNAKATEDKEEKSAKQHVTNVSRPTLSVFLPPKEKATGAAVIICPGGGYAGLVIKREGYDVAEAFVRQGIAAFVLKYRLPSEKTMIDPSVGPLQDAQQAIKTVRQRAAEWGVNPRKIGIMGFSAGGHLAATAGTHAQKAVVENREGTSLRPDFMILVYPVISFTDSLGHKGSRRNLLGDSPTAEKITLYSNERQVDRTTPITFLTHAGDDTVVPVQNSLVFYEALQKHGVDAELHLYSKGEHGYLTTPPFGEWFGRCLQWLVTSQVIPKTENR